MYIESAEVLKPRAEFFGGIHPDTNKNTAESEAVKMPAPSIVSIPLKQHIGAECSPEVKKDDRVLIGTKIGDSSAAMAVPVYSSVSGTVKEIKEINGIKNVIIESDGLGEYIQAKPIEVKDAKQLISAARQAGLVGLGGAGFPTHIKLEGAIEDVDTLIVNAAECEPYITSDYRTCLEHSDDILEGVYRIKDLLKIKDVIITVEENKPAAIEKLYEIAKNEADIDNSVRIMRLKTAYPQGAEKMLIYAATGRVVPVGKLPKDVGCLVMNVTTVATLNQYINTGIALTEKCITVDGSAVGKPQNVIVPIGAAVREVLEFCEADLENTEKILYGGPMMGIAIQQEDAVITKQNNAVLAFRQALAPQTTPCIRCGRCVAACPMRLTPARVEAQVNARLSERLSSLGVLSCIECGCCSFVCPAYRPLTHIMRTAKSILRRKSDAK